MSDSKKETPIAVERSPSLWWLPLLLGLLGGLFGAVVTMLIALSAIPTTYTAIAWLRIADIVPIDVNNGEESLLKREMTSHTHQE